jgi:hypothetical protein
MHIRKFLLRHFRFVHRRIDGVRKEVAGAEDCLDAPAAGIRYFGNTSDAATPSF